MRLYKRVTDVAELQFASKVLLEFLIYLSFIFFSLLIFLIHQIFFHLLFIVTRRANKRSAEADELCWMSVHLKKTRWMVFYLFIFLLFISIAVVFTTWRLFMRKIKRMKKINGKNKRNKYLYKSIIYIFINEF